MSLGPLWSFPTIYFISTSISDYSRQLFQRDISPSSLPMCLMHHSLNIKVGYGISAKLDRRSDRKTNGYSLVSRRCSLFLNLAQLLRFKTKLVVVIFSQPFLKRCHLVGVEVRVCECAACVCEMCKVGALLCICRCLHASVCVHLIGSWVGGLGCDM